MRYRLAQLALVTTLLAACGDSSDKIRLTGSGASFPYPIYSTWFKAYSREHADVLINYQAKGSGAGIRDFINGTVDFAGSDAAMSDAEIAEVDGGVVMIPITAGEIVIAYNLPGLEQPLRLGRDVYPRIFLGEIERWDDPAIQASNPGAPLANLPITVVRRADSSGTTYAFTNHLSAASPAWHAGPGAGKTVVWADSDKIVASPKNDGVTATILQTPGAIGYIEFGYAKFGKVPMAMLENRAGNFVLPGTETGRAALEGAVLPDDLRVWISDPGGEEAYPIVTYSWLLLRRQNTDSRIADTLKALVTSCLTTGQERAGDLGYLPLPTEVVDKSLSALETIS